MPTNAAGFNKFELEAFAKRAADSYLRDGRDMDDSITALARENGFTGHHVDRVAQTANTFVNGELVKQARAEKRDLRVSFKLASGEVVKKRLSGNDIGEMRKAASLHDSFRVEKRAVDNNAVLDGVMGKVMRDPLAALPRSLNGHELAVAYVKNAQVAKSVAGSVTSATLARTCQDLESMKEQATGDMWRAKQAAENVEYEIRDQVHDLLLDHHTPATLRSVIANGVRDAKLAAYVDSLVTKVAAELEVREGKSRITELMVVNDSHPLLTKVAEVSSKLDRCRQVNNGLTAFSEAAAAARLDFTRAAREGR